MGLDMYLRAKLFCWSTYEDESVDLKVNGRRVCEVTVELAYWRKHPNLHGFIVEEFAGGVDECQPISLNKEALLKILEASEGDALPETSGFFFGTSLPEDRIDTKQQIEAAIAWLDDIAGTPTTKLKPIATDGVFVMAEVVPPPAHEPEVKAAPRQRFSVESVYYVASW